MPFLDLYTELTGMVPNLPIPLAQTLVNRAWGTVRRNNLWSFQLYDGPCWITPPLINSGIATTVQGSASVVMDSVASALIAAAVLSPIAPIISRQFRIGAGTIYNITAWDGGTDTITLDRPYAEASVASAYSIFKCYYAAPYKDHLFFISVRNMNQFIDLLLDKTRSQIDAMDPQRTWYYFPTDCVYYQVDSNPISATYQYHLYELWGVPTAAYSYQLYGIRNGADLVNDTDTLPPQIGEDLVIEQAKFYVYQWAEAHKGEIGSKSDFKFLMGSAAADYKRLFKDYRRRDLETVNNWCAVRRVSLYGRIFAYYSSVTGTAHPGVPMGG